MCVMRMDSKDLLIFSKVKMVGVSRKNISIKTGAGVRIFWKILSKCATNERDYYRICIVTLRRGRTFVLSLFRLIQTSFYLLTFPTIIYLNMQIYFRKWVEE